MRTGNFVGFILVVRGGEEHRRSSVMRMGVVLMVGSEKKCMEDSRMEVGGEERKEKEEEIRQTA